MADRQQIETRDRYEVFEPFATRWSDNDAFRHVNNAVYYSYMDTAVTNFYLSNGLEDLCNAAVIPVAAETKCIYKRAIVHPAEIEVGLRVDRIGTRSVQCGVGFFLVGEDLARAWGYMAHVFIDRATNQPQPIPAALRQAFERIAVG
jgi:acyl-CoA thioester hydrolase